MTPAVNFAKERTILEFGQGQPILDCLHGAQAGECRAGEFSPFQLAISFAPREIAGHALARLDLDELDTQAGQFIRSESPPKSQQHQGAVAGMSQCAADIPPDNGCRRRLHQPVTGLLQDIQLQRFGALLLGRMQCPDAFQDLADFGGLGRVRKTVFLVPARQGRKAMLERVQR